MVWSFVPAILLPTFTWPHRTLGSVPLASTIPPAPSLANAIVRRIVGYFHDYLADFSLHYCRWIGIRFDNQVMELPFGLVLKRSDGTRLEEVSAMMVARSAGFPVPLVISYGDHENEPFSTSILMTRLPGKELLDAYPDMSEAERQTVSSEMQTMLNIMRSWPHPWGGERICSNTGINIRSVRIPCHSVKSCESEQEFNEYLVSAASPSLSPSQEYHEEKLACINKLHSVRHPIVFTHGDFKAHNIMVHNGRVSGFIDWESAGWYRDYWEFTTALRYIRKDYWWYDFVLGLAGPEVEGLLESERALTALTVDSYAW